MSVTDTDQTSPPFSALLAFAGVNDLRVAELVAAIQRLYPNARVMFWGGTGEPAQAARGILLSVNGLDMAIIHQRFAVPWAFDGGNQPNFCWQNAAEEVTRHKSHMFVMEAGRGKLSQSIARAGVVTMVVDAIASLNPIMGVRWEAAKNLMRADHFAKLAAAFRARATVPVALWIRLLSAYQPPAGAEVAGTFGLHSFGSPNVEIHARRLDFTQTLAAALSYAEVWLTTRRPTWEETITTIEDIATFSIEQLANGVFDIGPVAKLTELESADAPADSRPAAVVGVQPFRTAEDRVPAEDIAYNILVLQVAGGIRNAFYRKPKETWDAARLETARQLDGTFAKMEAPRAK
ncbi:MAG TPA: hypothetical protein VII40_09740 [Xanthobacteraceae bacterium]